MSATWSGCRGDSKEAKAKNGAGYQFRKGYEALSCPGKRVDRCCEAI